jgi:hypothetical protein
MFEITEGAIKNGQSRKTGNEKILIFEVDIRAGPHVIGVVPVVECQ